MLKLLLAVLVAGLIATGVYLYKQYDSQSESAAQTGNQVQNSLDAIEGAQDAVSEQQQRADDIRKKAQDAVQNYSNQ